MPGAVVWLAIVQQLQLGASAARIGAVDDPVQALHNVLRVIEDRTGRVFVTQLGTPFVAVFSAEDGRFLTQLGRRGAGPGEFAGPGWVGFRGDSVWVTDMNLRKYSLFTPTLLHARDIFLGTDPEGPVERAQGVPFSMVDPNRLVVHTSDATGYHWYLLDRGNVIALNHMQEQGAVARLQLAGRNVAVKQPFPDYTIIQPAPDGSAFFLIDRDQPSAAHVTKVGPSGDTIYRKPVITDSRTISDRQFDRELAGIVNALARMPVPRNQIAAEVRRAIRRPAFSYMISTVEISSDGVLWIGRLLPDSTSVWHAFDTAAGEALGELRLDRGRTLKTGRRSHVWILERDSLDVQYLVRYPLRSPASPPRVALSGR